MPSPGPAGFRLVWPWKTPEPRLQARQSGQNLATPPPLHAASRSTTDIIHHTLDLEFTEYGVYTSYTLVVITQNGKAAGVLLSPPAYDELTERFRFMRTVEQGLTDAEAGRVTPHEEVVAEMRRRFGGADDE